MSAIVNPAAAPLGLVNLNPATVPLTVKGAPSQSANLQEWQDSTGAVVAKVNNVGGMTIGGNSSCAGSFSINQTAVISNSLNLVSLIAKGSSGQTADLQQWQSSAAAVLAKVDSSGAIAPQNGARITSGSGAPTKPGGLNPVAGDVYHRTDVPGTSLSNIYICVTGGASPTWQGIA